MSEGLLRGYIREVRVVLGDDPETPRFIETVPRRGYRFLPAVTTTPASVSNQLSVSVEETTARDWSWDEPPLPDYLHLQLAPHLVGRDRTHTTPRVVSESAEGTRQVVFVTGEPGIGKTTLVDAFLQSLESQEFRVQESRKFGLKLPHSPNPNPRP